MNKRYRHKATEYRVGTMWKHKYNDTVIEIIRVPEFKKDGYMAMSGRVKSVFLVTIEELRASYMEQVNE